MATVLLLLASTVINLATASLVNVALNKPASMSTAYASKYKASTAVDGNTDASGYGANQIFSTAENQSFAWWKVDLQREVQDATVRIYFRTDHKLRRNGVELYTSNISFPDSDPTSQGQLCHTVTGKKDGSDIPDVYSVRCPGRYSYLLLYTDTDNNGHGPVLDFGEIEVLACSVETYGGSCTNTCSSRNCVTMTTTCERDGRCNDGCQSGWTGVDCTKECGSGSYGASCALFCINRRCLDGSSHCDHVTGQCVGGCQAGYKELDCTQQCDSGSYGPGCSLNCTARKCRNPASSCGNGCQSGYKGIYCIDKCDSGFYGDGCSLSCIARKCYVNSTVCDHVTGQCEGGCQAGYQGTDCRQEETPVYFTAASVVGAVIGTFIVVFLVIVGIHLCLVRQGRLQWVKNPGDKKQVQVSRDVTQMSNIASQSSDVSEHLPSSSHMYNNDYDVLDSGTKAADTDYDVIEQKHYQNV